MKATLPLTSFTGGEWSPRLHGRVDIAKYSSSQEILQNLVIYPHGGITRRMGMEYIEDAKSDNVRLIPFEYNREQAYVLEFGDKYIRFYRNGAQLQKPDLSGPLEVTTNYLASEIGDISFAQSNDVMYIVHEKHAPAKLSRPGIDSFTLADVVFTAKPAEWVANNYPRAVTFFQSRLVLAGTPSEPQTVWMSKVSYLDDFTTGSLAADSTKWVLSSTQNNAIQWVVPSKMLMIGTTGGEFSLYLPNNDATQIQVNRESNFGSKTTRTQLIGTGVVYTSRDGKKIREMTYSFDSDAFLSPELSLLSEHLTRSGIKEYDYAQNPDGILWTVMNDGSFCGFTYMKSQEVQGWHRHSTDGQVKSVCVIEADQGSEVWFAVYRNGKTRIEKMAPPFEGESPDDISCAYLDSYMSYEGAPVDTLSNLDHLEGKTVRILGDGYYLQDRVVEDGSITLERECSKIVVGLPYKWKVRPMKLEGGSPSGFAQGKKKKVESLILRLERSAGISYKIANDNLTVLLETRKYGENFGSPIQLISGDEFVKLPPSWDRDGQFELEGDSPFPVTILMVSANVVVNE